MRPPEWRRLREQGLTAVLDLSATAAMGGPPVPAGIAQLHWSLDGAALTLGLLDGAVKWLLHELAAGGKVLVQDAGTTAGQDSALVACASLIALGFPPQVAQQLLRSASPQLRLSSEYDVCLEFYAAYRQHRRQLDRGA